MDGKACLEVQLPMSKDDNKIVLKKTHEQATTIVGIFTVLIMPVILIGFLILEDANSFDPHQSELLFESGEELGYNWTEGNITVFETETGWDTPMYEEQCANGIPEACDYMLLREVAYQAWESPGGTNGFCGAACIIWPLLIVNLLVFGDRETLS